MKNKLAPLIVAVIFLLSLAAVFLIMQRPAEEPTDEIVEKQEESLEDLLIRIESEMNMEDRLLEAEESEELLEKYYRIENEYFIVLDKYYEDETPEGNLRSDSEAIMESLKNLKEEINNL